MLKRYTKLLNVKRINVEALNTKLLNVEALNTKLLNTEVLTSQPPNIEAINTKLLNIEALPVTFQLPNVEVLTSFKESKQDHCEQSSVRISVNA